MKTDSPYFDRIRVKPEDDRRARARPGTRVCAHPNCDLEATHRAPLGRDREGEFIWFCLDHVKEYNASYNYFAGMNDAAVAAYQKDALTGHRPTWSMGVNSWTKEGRRPEPRASAGTGAGFDPRKGADPFGLFEDAEWRQPGARAPEPEGRMIRNAERKALSTLNLDIHATAAEIKARFKELAKRLHPDSNGGDRSHEDKLREIIQAYNYLKSVGFC
ncbi:J domain-containing protein [Phreatobacter oligotrophus]|uniref:DnaJ-like protein n=1 Tax=Phreatobacter oligotrophus TaxID=1122261 RepID=A0A2T4YYJ8_9HYPH|nr:DnaJ domain-containing protein [Phreatobacter oligotrophus]PTM51780.1 DnaJ-like protein [Phreatobacter oligotrophus]